MFSAAVFNKAVLKKRPEDRRRRLARRGFGLAGGLRSGGLRQYLFKAVGVSSAVMAMVVLRRGGRAARGRIGRR